LRPLHRQPFLIGNCGRKLLKKTYAILAVTVGLVLILDQWTKHLVDSGMYLHQSFPVVKGFINITYVRNPGAAFGFLSGIHSSLRVAFFFLVSAAAIVLIVYYLKKYRVKDMLLASSLSLILAGAAGNLIDRVRFGEVIDFVDVHVAGHHWPAFNVADSAISIGAVLLIWDMLRKRKSSR